MTRTDADIKAAAKEWCLNPVLALAEYGHISCWNVSLVTNMRKLFCGQLNFNEDINQTGASSAMGAKFGVAFPRVEVSLPGGIAGVWAQTAFVISGTFIPSFPACQTADAEFAGQGGFNLLGLSDWTYFFQEPYILLRTAECPDGKEWGELWSAEELGVEYLYE